MWDIEERYTMHQAYVLKLIVAQKFGQVDWLQQYSFRPLATYLLFVSAQILSLSGSPNLPNCYIKFHLCPFVHILVKVALLGVHVYCQYKSCRMSFEGLALQVLLFYLYVEKRGYHKLASTENQLQEDALQLLREQRPKRLEFVLICTVEQDLPSPFLKSIPLYSSLHWMVQL